MRQVILDTETTGLKPADGHRIIEVGCIEMINRRLTGKTFHHYINPQREIDAGAQQVHGITQEFLKGKPVFDVIVEGFLDFVRDSELIIHNAPFDVGFLEHEFKLAKIKPTRVAAYCKVFDTLKLARQMHPGQSNSLDALCKRYQVNNKHREWHGALLDSELLAQVYLAMTGGQSTLFGEAEDEKKSLQAADVDISRQKNEYQKTRVIYANVEELAEDAKWIV
jgi:DNA polymerase-3 subunit epsilon